MAGNVAEFTDANFETDVLKSDQPVLVDFWAPWCGPCKLLTPTIEALAEQYTGKVHVGKVNTDENPKVSSGHNISAIPTVILFKGGQPVERFTGVTPKDKFTTAINNHLG
jgi:thioredoxin